MVVLLHAGAFLKWKPISYFGARTGVDLFFCISGFVICRSFQPFFDRHRGDGQWWRAVRAFWVRRIFRLVPSAWLWLLIAIGCSWAFNHTGWFSSLEDIALIFVQALLDRSPIEHPYLWNTRLDALMWGCVISQFFGSATYFRWEPKLLRRRLVAWSTNAVLFFLLVNLPHTYHLIPNFRTEGVVALISAALVLFASFDAGYILPVSRPLQNVLSWIGSRSYGIYLIHAPVFGFIQDMGYRALHLMPEQLGPWYRFVYVMSAAALIPILAELNFRFVETPLRRKGKQLAQRIMARRPTSHQAAPQAYEQAIRVETVQTS